MFAVKFSISVLLGAEPLPETLLLLSSLHAVVRRNALLNVAGGVFFLVGVSFHDFPSLYSNMTVEKKLSQHETEEKT